MRIKRRKIFYWVLIFLFLVVGLPNIINFRERKYFSDENRLKIARELSAKVGDSIIVIPGEYYKRGSFYKYFFGEKNRELWTVPIKVKVFNYAKTGLVPYEMGGSQQTISIRLKDSSGKSWVLRSVNKDQKNVLSPWLRPTFLRWWMRDEASSINPYASLVVKVLAETLQIPHVDPELYWLPYDSKYGEYNTRMAGRLVYLEKHLNESWKGDSSFYNAEEVFDTDSLQEPQKKTPTQKKTPISIDTLLYLRTRLFDFLISDWDRHKDQWKWLLIKDGKNKKLIPVGRDRDMAFYVFDEGLLNKLILVFNDKFQSFRKDFADIEGLSHQSKEQDRKILSGFSKRDFYVMAESIQQQLTAQQIHYAFLQYPSNIYLKFGRLHEEILQSRLQSLPLAATKFYEIIHKN
jgi:hypothetical protein